MQCPKCSGDTCVVDSRLDSDHNVTRRRRYCDIVTGCGNRFTTWEATTKPTRMWRAKRAERDKAAWAGMSREEKQALMKRRDARRYAREVYAKEGGDLEALYVRYGAPSKRAAYAPD